MWPTARGHFRPKQSHDVGGLSQELGRRIHNEAPGVPRPGLGNAVVDLSRLPGRLDAEGIGVVVSVLGVRHAQVDDGVVARELLGLRRAQRSPEVLRPWPIRETVNSSAIAQDECRVRVLLGVLELALHEEDRTLAGPPDRKGSIPGESPAEYDPARFGEHGDVPAERVTDQLQNCGLARARPTGENDALGIVAGNAGAGRHPVGLESVGGQNVTVPKLGRFPTAVKPPAGVS